MKKHWLTSAALPLFLMIACVSAHASGIYTCVDAKGRRHTSDRPIAACLDREQRLLSKSGVEQRVIPPSTTPEERIALAAQAKLEEALRKEERAKAKSMAALLQRYPNEAAHQAARKAETEPVMARIREGHEKIKQIRQERTKLDKELEFYKKTPDNMPAKLRTQVQAIINSEQAAHRYIASQQKELSALQKRFDAEKAQLETLWKK